ncbi:MAG: DUF4124 domain-containing protein [Nitrosomonadales bacterium]|nr:DUF4124 domain-containing protein [Nitrosomonadales bacterium]
MKTFLLAIFLAFFSLSAHAALSKWVDENGKVHYSDQPPLNVKTTTLRTSASPSTPAVDGDASRDAPAAQKTYVEREAELKKAQQAGKETAERAAQEQEVAEVNRKNCEIARSNLASLQAGGRLVEYDANGERRFVEDAELRQRIAKEQQDIGTFCK